jgi:hypothetical protein
VTLKKILHAARNLKISCSVVVNTKEGLHRITDLEVGEHVIILECEKVSTYKTSLPTIKTDVSQYKGLEHLGEGNPLISGERTSENDSEHKTNTTDQTD